MQKGFCVVFKKLRSTVVVNRRALFYFNYAIGAYRLGSAEHLIRHLTVTPSPTGEGNRKALFRQQILVRLLTEEWVKLAFSCERRGTALAVDE